MYVKYLKRILDIMISFFGLIFISPILLVLLIVVTIANRGTPIFFQKRPGINGKQFNLYKIKTMDDRYDINGNLLSDHERLTMVGRLIRSLSLDELPQLFNVLKGDMSLIGPRPLLIKYLSRYNVRQARRHEVRPGITGWAQVNGRNAINWEEKFDHDVYYVDNLSFWLDIKIIWYTILKVLKREGINNAPGRPMDEFLGS